MEEKNLNFEQGIALLNVNPQKAIKLFQKVFEDDPGNFASLNYMAVAKIRIGLRQKDKQLLKDAIMNLEDAVKINKKMNTDGGDYRIAEDNLEWAIQELNKLNH